MSIEAARLSVVVDADTKKAESGLSRMGGVVSGAGRKLATFAAAGVGAAAASAVGLAKAGMSLEDSLTPIGTLLGTNTQQFKSLSGALTDFMTKTPTSGAEIGSAAYMALSAGITGTKDVMDALRASQQLAEAGLGDMGGAMDLVTSAINSFKDEGLTAQSAAEGFFGAIASGKTTTNDLAQGFGSIAPLAASAGVSFNDLLAATAALTSTGMEASVAYSGIRGALTSVVKPTAEASKLAKSLGLEFNQAHLKAVGLPRFLDEVKQATGGNVEKMGALFGSVEGLNSVLALTGPQAEAFAANIDGIGAAGDDLADRAKEVENTWSNRWKTMKNAVSVHAGQIGLKIADWLQPRMKRLVDWVRAHWPQISAIAKSVAEKFADAWEKYGKPALTAIVDGISWVVRWVIDHWPQISDVIRTVFDGVRSAVRFVVEEVFPRIVRAVRAVVQWVSENWPKFRDVIKNVIDWISTNVVPVVKRVFGFIVEQVRHVVEWVRTRWPQISEAIRHVMSVIKGIVERVLGAIQAFWRTFGTRIITFVKGTWDKIHAIISTAMAIIKGVIEFVMAVINGDWGKAWDAIKSMVVGIWNGIKEFISGTLKQIGAILSSLGTIVAGAVSGAWDKLTDGLGTAIGSVLDFFRGLPGKITGAIGSVATTLVSFGTDLIAGLLNGITSKFTDIFLWLVNLPDTIIGFAGSALKVLYNWGYDLIKGLWEGIKAAWNWFSDLTAVTVPKVHIPGTPFDIGGFSFRLLPRLATGGRALSDGLAMVGEKGAEVVKLAKGDAVYPHGAIPSELLGGAGATARPGSTTTSMTVVVQQGAIVVQGATDPRATAKFTVEALRNYVRLNGAVPITVR